MPVHDWSRVAAGIYHDFHQSWITDLKKLLNDGALPTNYYALAEQRINPIAPDVLTLKGAITADRDFDAVQADGGVVIAPPQILPVDESDLEVYRRKQNRVAIRHVSDDSLVAVIEIVSPGNKSGRNAMSKFVNKSIDLIARGIHLTIVDITKPTKRDPHGIHAVIREEMTDRGTESDLSKPLTTASYDASNGVRAFVEHFAVGDTIPSIPLFLQHNGQIPLPLEQSYQAAWSYFPSRWRSVLEAH